MGVIIRQSIKGTLATYIGIVIGYVNVIYFFPKYFSEEEVGVIRFMLEAAQVITGFTLLGTTSSMIRFYPRLNPDLRDRGFAFLSFVIPVFGFLIFLLLSILFKTQIVGYFTPNAGTLVQYFPLVLILSFFTMLSLITETYCSIKNRITFTKISREIFLRAGLTVVAYFFGKNWLNFEQTLYVVTAINGLQSVINIIYLHILSKPDYSPSLSQFDQKTIREYLAFTGLIVVSSFGGIILSRLDFIMVSSMEGMAATGIFSTAFYIAMVIDIPKRALHQISSPLLSAEIHYGNLPEIASYYKKSAQSQTLVAAIIFLAIWVNIDSVFDLMPNGDSYRTGKWVFFFIGMSRLIDMASGLGSVIIANSKFYIWSVPAGFITTLIAVGANLILIPRLGITGAAAATAISFLILTLYIVVLIYIKMKIHPFNYKTLLLWIFTLVITLSASHFHVDLENIWLEMSVNTLIYLIPFIAISYVLNISEDINSLAKRILKLNT